MQILYRAEVDVVYVFCSVKMSKYRDNKRPGVLYTRNFILRSLCGIYLMAFVSFYHQSEGEYPSCKEIGKMGEN